MSDAIRTEQLTVGTLVTSPADGRLFQGVIVKADADNTDSIYVGGASVTAETGYVLLAGETVFIPCVNMADVGAISGSEDQLLYVIGG